MTTARFPALNGFMASLNMAGPPGYFLESAFKAHHPSWLERELKQLAAARAGKEAGEGGDEG